MNCTVHPRRWRNGLNLYDKNSLLRRHKLFTHRLIRVARKPLLVMEVCITRAAGRPVNDRAPSIGLDGLWVNAQTHKLTFAVEQQLRPLLGLAGAGKHEVLAFSSHAMGGAVLATSQEEVKDENVAKNWTVPRHPIRV